MSNRFEQERDLGKLLMGERISYGKEEILEVKSPTKVDKIMTKFRKIALILALSSPAVSCVEEDNNKMNYQQNSESSFEKENNYLTPFGIEFNEDYLRIRGMTQEAIGVVVQFFDENGIELLNEGFICDGDCNEEISFLDGTVTVRVNYHLDGRVVTEETDIPLISNKVDALRHPHS